MDDEQINQHGSDDGADLGIGCEDGMKTVLGGKQPEPMSDVEFEKMVRQAPADMSTYDSAGAYAARLVLEFLEAHPDQQVRPIEAVGEWRRGEVTITDFFALRGADYVKVQA